MVLAMETVDACNARRKNYEREGKMPPRKPAGCRRYKFGIHDYNYARRWKFVQDTSKVLSAMVQCTARMGILRRSLARRHAGDGARANNLKSHEISFAKPKAAAAASPPITMVCNALRAGPVPV